MLYTDKNTLTHENYFRITLDHYSTAYEGSDEYDSTNPH